MFGKTFKDKPRPTLETMIRHYLRRAGPLSYMIAIGVVILLYIFYSYFTVHRSYANLPNEHQLGKGRDHFLGPDLAVIDDQNDVAQDVDAVDIEEGEHPIEKNHDVEAVVEKENKGGVKILDNDIKQLNADEQEQKHFVDNLKRVIDTKMKDKSPKKEEKIPKIPFNVHNHDLDEVDEDYILAHQHNEDPNLLPVLPKFDPNRHIHGALPEEEVYYPSPKIFPVPIILSPNVENCPKDQPFVLIIVTSMANQSGHRNAIRRSWAKQQNFKPVSLRNALSWWVVFSIGAVEGTENRLKNEQEHYGDILQGSFLDHPSEETRKTLLSFKWAVEMLPADCRPLLVLKTECSVFVNTPLLTKWITDRMAQNTGIYVGKVIRDDVPIRDLRISEQVPQRDYPLSTFPPYARGPSYLLSMDVLTIMLTLVREVTPIAMEDAYIGLLAHKMGRAPQNRDNFQVMDRPKNQCHYLEMLFIRTGKATVHHQIFMVVNHQREECLDKKDL